MLASPASTGRECLSKLRQTYVAAVTNSAKEVMFLPLIGKITSKNVDEFLMKLF